MPELDGFEGLIEEIERDVRSAGTLEEALRAVTVALREPYRLWRSSVWRFLPPDSAVLQAIWAIGDTAFEPGMQVRFSLTSDAEFLATSVLAGKPMMMRTKERDLGLLTDMLRREGVASAVIVPVGRKPKKAVGLLVLASSKSDVFRSSDVRFAAALARAIGAPLTDLMETVPEGSA